MFQHLRSKQRCCLRLLGEHEGAQRYAYALTMATRGKANGSSRAMKALMMMTPMALTAMPTVVGVSPNGSCSGAVLTVPGEDWPRTWRGLT